MANLNIDVGVKEYTLNDKVTVFFNPTDMTLLEDILNKFKLLEEKEKERSEKVKTITDPFEMADVYSDMDKQMRDVINSIFGVDICTPLIGDVNIYARAGGFPIWANILVAIVDEFDEQARKENARGEAKFEKYMKKYKRK